MAQKKRTKREDANNNLSEAPVGEFSQLLVSVGQRIDERLGEGFAELHGKIDESRDDLHARCDELDQRFENQGESEHEDSDRRESGSEDEGGHGDEIEEDDGVEREDSEEDIESDDGHHIRQEYVRNLRGSRRR